MPRTNQASGIWAEGRDDPAVLHVGAVKATDRFVLLPSTSFLQGWFL